MAVKKIAWAKAWRIIPSRYPPIDLFERLTDNPAIWEALLAAEQMTNPRVRQEHGQISLVPPEERISGPGATYVMASFTHLNPKGSRFSDGTYGVYYAASELETAIAETVYHFQLFARASNDPPRHEDMRVLVGSIENKFEDLSALDQTQQQQLLAPDTYVESQAYARRLRAAGSAGIFFPSVRRREGLCVAAFRPKVVGIPMQERHLQYFWNGNRVEKVFDYSTDLWTTL